MLACTRQQESFKLYAHSPTHTSQTLRTDSRSSNVGHGTNPRDPAWEALIQSHLDPFYKAEGLGNIGARVRGGLSDEEGSSAAWHPLIERAAEYGPQVAIIEVARAIDIADKAGSIEAGNAWAAPLFDALAEGMLLWAKQQSE